MLKFNRWTILAAIAVVAPAFPAQAATDALVAQAMALHKEGKTGEAYLLLKQHLAERAEDPDYNFAMGISALDSGHVAEAILAFQRVLAVQPDNAQARSELARAYVLSGDIDTAKAQFDTVLQDPTLPDPVRNRFKQLVTGYSRQITGKGHDVSGFADISGGYDSNINTATDLTSITIPLFAVFGPGALNGTARQTHDGFGDVQAGVSGVIGVNRTDRAFGSVLANYHGNFQNTPFNQASATGTFGYAHSYANRDSLSVSGQVQQFWLGDASYRQAYGAIGQYTHLLSGGRALSLSAQFFRFHYDNQPLLNANRYALALSYAERKFVFSTSAGREKTLQLAGDHLSNWFGDASIAAELPLTQKLSFIGGVGIDLRRYEAVDPLFLVKRRDERIDASAGFKLLVAKNFSLRPRVSYTRNFSNIAINDFERWTTSIGARLEF